MAQTVKKHDAQTEDIYNTIFWGVLLFLAAIVTYFIYAKGFSAGWTFDDKKYLHPLGQVSDLSGAIAYILQDKGISVFDRPISMASFLLNVNDWPGNRSGFRRINVVLHILNATLVAFIAHKVAQFIPRLSSSAHGFAVTLAVIWMFHPLLASTSFHVIQRMVLLAATFSLAGVFMYLLGRSYLINGKRHGYVWMTTGILFSAGLGTLAKENAVLTPLMIAVLEFTVLSRYAPLSDRFLRQWQLLFFGVPVATLVVFGGYYLFKIAPETYLFRPFTIEERIYSEGVILLEYVRQILVPDVTTMGPFQDDVWRIRGSSVVAWSALTSWVLLIAIAVFYRHRFPALSFGILFFLTGHLLESTFFSLELYFEHRNYLPSLGPIGAIIALAWSSVSSWPRYCTGCTAVLLALLLGQASITWGDPRQSALTWYENHPSSTRAIQNLASYYQSKADFDTATATIIGGYENNPLDGALALNAVISTCFNAPKYNESQIITKRVARDAPRIHFSPMVIKTLHNQINLFNQGQCNSFDAEQLIAISNGFLNNPAFQKPDKQYGLIMAISRALQTQGRIDEATAAKISAFRIYPILKTAHSIFQELAKEGKLVEAHKFLDEARRLTPLYSDKYDAWEKAISDG